MATSVCEVGDAHTKHTYGSKATKYIPHSCNCIVLEPWQWYFMMILGSVLACLPFGRAWWSSLTSTFDQSCWFGLVQMKLFDLCNFLHVKFRQSICWCIGIPYQLQCIPLQVMCLERGEWCLRVLAWMRMLHLAMKFVTSLQSRCYGTHTCFPNFNKYINA